MKLIHLSDTHLGFSAYRALDKEWGINQREADINRTFAQAIEKALALKPEAVIHSGDLFDSVRPSNRTISFCLEQLLRLAKAEIPVVMIAGNHSSPRMRDTGSIFRLFELFENVYPVYKGQYETVALNGLKPRGPAAGGAEGLTIHAIPQCPTKEEFHKELQKLNGSRFSVHGSRFNVLMLHAGVAEIKEFSMGEFNEQIVPLSSLKPEFDYIGLGHYHRFAQVAENVYYSGSTERYSFGEAGQEKGIVEVNLSENTREVIFHPLEIREMVDYPPLNTEGLATEAVMKKIEEILSQKDPQDKITRLTLENISNPVCNSLDFHHLRNLTSAALHFELRYKPPKADEQSVLGGGENFDPKIGGLITEFSNYISQMDLEKNKNGLLKLGLKYLELAFGGEE